MKIELRDYQSLAFDQAREAIRNGARAVLINAPTGSGKTVIGSALMEMVMEKQRRANFVVDRLSLIDQTSAMFDRYGLPHGVIQSEHMRYRPGLPIQVCSAQTLARRGWPEANVDVIDECHILSKATIARIESGRSIVIGLTATPFTKGLGKYFKAIVNVTTTRKLIDDGWLSPYRIFACVEPDMEGVKVRSTGEWDETETTSRALKVVGDVVQEYIKHGENRKFICSGATIAHCEELTRQFLAAGINVSTYTADDRAEDRQEVVAEFRKPDSVIRGLVTVTAASRGFDVPDVSCIIIARPLRKSLAEHIQLFGRGLRPYPGKEYCLVLDHAGNCKRFWDDTEEFFDAGLDELDDGIKKPKPKPVKGDEASSRKCPQCGHLHKPMPFCPACGHQYPPKASVQHVPGTLKELISGGHHDVLKRQLWPQVCGYVLERREGEAAKKQALAIYKSITGEFPRGAWFESTTPAPPSHEVRSRIRASQIKFAHGMKNRQAA